MVDNEASAHTNTERQSSRCRNTMAPNIVTLCVGRATIALLLLLLVINVLGGPSQQSCDSSRGWQSTGADDCLLVSSDLNHFNNTWSEAKDACKVIHPYASLASLPTDQHYNSIAVRLQNNTPYWIGMKVPYNQSQLVWSDGRPETRTSLFHKSSAVSNGYSPIELCGHVTLKIYPQQRDLTWFLDLCNDLHPYICLLAKNKIKLVWPPNSLANNSTLPSQTLKMSFSSKQPKFHKDLMRQLKCSSSDIKSCLVKEIGASIEHNQDKAFLASVNLVLNDLQSQVGMSTNYTSVLMDFLHISDTLLAIGHNTGRHELQQVDHYLIRLEAFLERLVSHIGTKGQSVDFVTNLRFIDVVLRSVPVRSLNNHTIRWSLGEVTILGVENMRNSNLTNTSFVSAILIKAPSVTVNLSTRNDNAIISSPVISLNVFNGNTKQHVFHQFSLNIQNITDSNPDFICAFQKPAKKTTAYWDTFGCKLTTPVKDWPRMLNTLTTSNTTASRLKQDALHKDWIKGSEIDILNCYCNHTTNFAILLRVVDFEVDAIHEKILSVVTYIGCSVTLISQLVAVTVFICIGTSKSERVCVHLNLCLAVIGLQLTFITGIKAVGNKIICSMIAVVLHYFSISTFVWMLVEGMHLYSQVVTVFGTERSRIVYYKFFGWGVPAVIVTISAAVDWQGYGTTNSCWLSITRGTIWVFVGPAVAVVLLNILILGLVLRIVVASARADGRHEHDHVRAGVKAALFLIPLLGITWLFGLAAVNNDLLVFQYLFAIFNSLQGFFIFLFHCVLNTEVRQTLKRLKEKRSLQKGDFTASSNSAERSSSESREEIRPGSGDTSLESFNKKINRVTPQSLALGDNSRYTRPKRYAW